MKTALLFTFFLVAFPVSAAETCAPGKVQEFVKALGRPKAHRVPSTLQFRTDTKVLPVELEEAGKLLRTGASHDLSNLPDGIYIWLTDAKGNLIYDHRVGSLKADITKPDAKYLTTHRGLYARLLKLLPGSEIKGGGEFQIVNGRVLSLNNRTGSFWGSEEHLNYGKDILKEKGLRVEEKTRLRDYADPKNRNESHHATAAQDAAAFLKYHNTPEYNAIADVYRKLATRFPNPEKPGLIDSGLSSPKLVAVALKSDEKTSEIAFDATSLIGMIQSDGIAFTMQRFYEQGRTPQNINDMLALIRKVVLSP